MSHSATKTVRKTLNADEEDDLHQGINLYRASLNLTLLTKNERAECLASEIADQFNNQPCTNSTGANTLPGTEPQYRDFPTILRKCNLNVNTTQVMPACVPNLDSDLDSHHDPNLVLSSFTKSQYSGNLNNTRFSGIGIGTEDNWIVVVVTTNAPDGSYSLATNSNSNGAVKVTDIGRYMVFFIIGVSVFLL